MSTEGDYRFAPAPRTGRTAARHRRYEPRSSGFPPFRHYASRWSVSRDPCPRRRKSAISIGCRSPRPIWSCGRARLWSTWPLNGASGTAWPRFWHGLPSTAADPKPTGSWRSCLPIIGDCPRLRRLSSRPAAVVPMAWPERIGAATRDAHRCDVMLGFRYWMDEPGNDVMWYFSENHALLFHTACHLAGTLLPDATFTRQAAQGGSRRRSGANGSSIGSPFRGLRDGRVELRAVFPHRPQRVVRALRPLARCGHPRALRERDPAASRDHRPVSHHGLITASQGRSYEHTSAPGATLEFPAIAWVAFGCGWYGRRFHALPQLALCMREHGLTLTRALPQSPTTEAPEPMSGVSSRARTGSQLLYHYKTRDWRWGALPDTAGASGATRRRCCICASATAPKPRSGSTIRAR